MNNKITRIKYTNLKSGFTILETLVALSIFTTSILGIIVVSGKGISDLTVSKERLTGIYLAQEGVELGRNLRDNSFFNLNTDSWQQFMTDTNACSGANKDVNGCDIQQTGAVVACSVSPGCPLSYNSTSGKFISISAGTPSSGFYRKIVLIPDPDSQIEHITIVSTVTWGRGSITLISEVYNWK